MKTSTKIRRVKGIKGKFIYISSPEIIHENNPRKNTAITSNELIEWLTKNPKI